MAWTVEQVLALAPDASAQKTARDLASARKWTGLGRSEAAVWGDCKGSAADPYHSSIDLSEPAFRCTCPSRKFPCKHGLALLLIYAGDPNAIPVAAAPQWVAEWLAKRTAKAERAKAQQAPLSAEEQATKDAERAADQARRAQRRESRVADGVDALRLWLTDLVREGLRELPTRPRTFWDQPAARMVDAQAPGLGRRIAEMSGLPYSGTGWPPQLLMRAGQLYLLIEAYRHIDQLPPDLARELRSQLGFAESTDDVLALGERIEDDWAVIGRRVTLEDQLRVQRTWLWGRSTDAPALILDFVHPQQPKPPDVPLVPGTSVRAELAFYPGSARLRALIQKHDAAHRLQQYPGRSIKQALAEFARRLSTAPWTTSTPLAIGPVRPVRNGDQWLLVEEDGTALPFDGPHGWQVLAVSGGRPINVFGEWDGDRLSVLSAWGDDGFANLEVRP